MKKLVKIMVLTFFLFSVIALPINNVVFADAVMIENSANGIVDNNLYNALLEQVNLQLNSENQITKLYENSLSHISSGVLNLTNKNISNLSGIEKLAMENITEINLSYNNLTVVSSNVFLTCTNLRKLNISNNKLTSIDLSRLTKLQELNLSQNKLTSINLSKLAGTPNEYVSTIKLNNNSIDSLSKIKFPSEQISGYIIDISHNNISVYETPNSVHKFNVGIQGVFNNETSVAGKSIYLFETYEQFDNLIAKIFYNTPNQLYYTQLDLINNYVTITTADHYTIKFFNNESEIINNENYNTINFTIKPKAPEVKVEIDGVEFDNIEKLTKQSILRFYGAGTIYVKVNNENWININSVTLTEKGIYDVSVKSVQNNLESEIVSFTIPLEYKNDSAKKIIGFVILGAILIGLGYLAINYRKGIGFFKKNAKKNNNKSKEQ